MTAEPISQAQWDAAPALWTMEQGYSGYGGPEDSVFYVEYQGRRFPRNGSKWPLATARDLVSPGYSRIAIFGWDGLIQYPGGEGIFGPFTPAHNGRYKGKYWIDVYDVASATRLIQIHGDFKGFDPFGDPRASLFLTGRYYLFLLDAKKHRKILVCDVDAAARAKGAVAEDPPPRFAPNLYFQHREIQEENPKVRLSSLRDEAVTDPSTGKILAVDLTASLAVSAAGRYRLRIQLGVPIVDGRIGRLFPNRELEADLEPGPRIMTIRFPVHALRGLKADGPWNIELVKLSHPITEGTGVDYLRFDAGKTQSYKLSEMAPQ